MSTILDLMPQKNSQNVDQSWVFHNVRVQQRAATPRIVPTHYISLSLDKESRDKFAGVRLVVVTDMRWPGTMELPVVDDWPAACDISEQELYNRGQPEYARSPIDPLKGLPSMRALHKAHRLQKEKDAHLRPDSVALVVLKLVAESLSDLSMNETNRCCYILTPLNLSKLPKDSDSLLPTQSLQQPPQLSVVHDRNYSITQPNYSRLIKLRCSWLYSSRGSSSPYFLAQSTNLSYHIRIMSFLPLRSFRQATLPPSIIRKIAKDVIDLKPDYQTDMRWARPLLSYALVQKSWAHVGVDLLWNLVGSGTVPVINLPALIHCLKSQPQRVHSIRTFDFMNAFKYTRFFLGWTDRFAQNLSPHSARDFFWTATSLRSITVNYSFLQSAREALAALKHVEHMCITADPRARDDRDFMPKSLLSLYETLEVIRNWASLKRLEVSWWGDHSAAVREKAQVSYPLEHLKLLEGCLHGDELFHVTSHLPPTLISVHLQGIHSLPNSQLRKFLLQSRHTLEKLVLRDIDTEEISQSEESALDSCISEMQMLLDLTTTYGLFTNRGISRKQVVPSGAVLRVEAYTPAAMRGAPDAMSLSQAIAQGHWKEIHLTCSSHLQKYWTIFDSQHPQKVEEVKGAALRRGVILTLPKE